MLKLYLLASLLCVPALAAAQENIEGEYTKPVRMCFVSGSKPISWTCEGIREEGVAIKKRDSRSYYVFLKTRGANGHSCEYNGIGRIKDSVLVTASQNPECKISVHIDGITASFRSEGEGCGFYCGARSSLDANNLKKKIRLPKHERNG